MKGLPPEQRETIFRMNESRRKKGLGPIKLPATAYMTEEEQ